MLIEPTGPNRQVPRRILVLFPDNERPGSEGCDRRAERVLDRISMERQRRSSGGMEADTSTRSGRHFKRVDSGENVRFELGPIGQRRCDF